MLEIPLGPSLYAPLADNESLGKSAARYGDADVEVDDSVVLITEKMKEARLRWFGHVLRREEDSVAKTALKLDVSGVRSRGRPKIRWLDRVKLDMIDGVHGICFELLPDNTTITAKVNCAQLQRLADKIREEHPKLDNVRLLRDNARLHIAKETS
ncbi:hypothetical protein RB195_003189 [Necator americanus]|uniref:Transposase n=1 Tax=Necator americanus TaxID=51031 RepID=A0ABR1DNR6_NECAM